MLSTLRRVFSSEWSAPVLVFCVSLVGFLPWLAPGGPRGWDALPRALNGDEGTVLYEALRVANGEVMYRDFFAFQGPVFSWLIALAFKLVDPTVEVAAAVQLLISATTAMLLTLVVLRVTGRQSLGLAAGLIYASLIVPAFPYAYPHWTGAAFVCAALVALLPSRGPPSHLRLVLAGGLVGLGVAAVQSLGPVAIGGLAAVFFSTRLTQDARAAIRASLAYAAGGLGVGLSIFLFFAANGALHRFWWSVFVWPLKHYTSINRTTFAENLPDALGAHAGLDAWLRLPAQAGTVVLVALPLIGLVGGLAVVVRGVLQKNNPKALIAGWVALTAVVPLYVAGSRRDVVHLAFLGAFGLVAFAAVFSQFLAKRKAADATMAATVGFALLCTGVFVWKRQHAAALEPERMSFRQAWAQSSETAERFLSHVVPGQYAVFGVDGSGGFAYFFSGARNATSFTYLPFGWRAKSEYLTPTQWQQAADEILERQPLVVVLDAEQWQRLEQVRPQLIGLYSRR